jgi:hypothetical protein
MGYNPRILLGNRAPISVQFMEKPCVVGASQNPWVWWAISRHRLYYVVKHGMQSNDMSSGVANTHWSKLPVARQALFKSNFRVIEESQEQKIGQDWEFSRNVMHRISRVEDLLLYITVVVICKMSVWVWIDIPRSKMLISSRVWKPSSRIRCNFLIFSLMQSLIALLLSRKGGNFKP